MFKETRASGRNRQKNSLKDCVFVNLALKKYTQKNNTLKKYTVKNTLLQTAFSAILPNFCCLSRLTIGKKLILAKYSILTNDERCKNCDILNYINRNCQQLI